VIFDFETEKIGIADRKAKITSFARRAIVDGEL